MSFSYASAYYDQEIRKLGCYIMDRVYIGTHSTIIGSDIGSESVVGANSFLIEQKVLSNTIIAGTPARKIIN